MPQRLRVFVSSPGDVADERLRADLIIDKLSQEYGRYFTLESYRWEHEPMLASGHFQDAIEPPSHMDIVLLILWSRLGTPLPEQTGEREYRGLDGRAPVTGTEWEFEEALASARARGAPDILVFRNVSPASIDARDPAARSQKLAQLDALDAFWKRYFADRGVFLAAFDEYKSLEEFAGRLEESLRKLIERYIKTKSATAGAAAAPLWTGNPFRGLESYEFEHASIFFGRDAMVAKGAELLAANARGGQAFLLVSGASGSGKSSLVKAAIVPRLMKPQRIAGAAFLRRAIFRPGDAPNDLILGLVEALTRGGQPDGVGLPELLAAGQHPADLATHVRTAAGSAGFLFSGALARLTESNRAARRILAYEEAKLLLVIDQLEELFTLDAINVEERRTFLQLLTGLAKSGAVWVVATMRADFWHRAAEMPELIALAEGQGRLDVPAPSAAELAEMIRKPALAAGLGFELHPDTGLGLDAVLAEHASAQPGVLPLLSFTLDALYAEDIQRRGGRELTYQSYDRLGGLEGAIATRADEVVAALPTAAQAAVPRVLRMLTTVSSTAEQAPVSRSTPLAHFPPSSDARAVVDAFTQARLLVAATEGTTPIVRLAHEALITRWTRAREQLTADRRDLETRSLVERAQIRWRDADANVKRQLLLRDPDLANALDLKRRWGDEVDPDASTFIAASRQRARLRQRLTAGVAVVFGLVAITASALGVVAYQAQQQADSERGRAVEAEGIAVTRRDEAVAQRNASLVAQSRYLASEADTLVNDGTVRGAIALLRVALPGVDGLNPRPLVRDAIVSAYHALYANRERRRYGMPEGATAVAADKSGKKVVIATATGLHIREGASTSSARVLPHSAGTVARVVLADNGERAALISNDGAVSVHDFTEAGERQCQKPDGLGVQVFFLNGGQRLLVASNEMKTWHLFNADTCQPLGQRQIEVPDGKGFAYFVDAVHGIIALVADDTVRTLSSEDLSQLATTTIEPAAEYALTLTADGKALYIAAAKDILTGSISVLDSETLAPQRTFGKVTGGARHLAISANGKWLAVHVITGIDFFDVQTGERMVHMNAGRDAVNGRFPADGTSYYIAYGGHGFVRRYSPELGVEIGAYRNNDGGMIENLIELPDRTGFLTLSDRPSITEWSFDSQIISRPYTVPLIIQGVDMRMPAMIEASANSNDRTTVLAAYIDRSARLWNLETGEIKLVRGPQPRTPEIEHVAQVGERSVLVEKSGRILVYGDKGTPAELAGEPLSYLGALDERHALAVTKSGTASLIDVSAGPDIKMIPIPALAAGQCARAASIEGGALCLDKNDAIRIYRAADSRVAIELPAPAGAKVASAYLSDDGKLIAVTYTNGDLLVKAVEDGKTIAQHVVRAKLSGDVLRAAAQSPLLTEEDRATIRRGAKEIEVKIGANRVTLSPDGKWIAMGMPNRTVQIIDLATGKVWNTKGANRAAINDLVFSPNGQLIAAIEQSDYRALNIYEAGTGERLASISLGAHVSPRLVALPSGLGFATIEDGGRMAVHPIFQNAADLIGYLAREFPEPLTPNQRRAYFLE